MRLLSKLSQWYFSKRTLPYWCILILDCLFVLLAGNIAYLILNGHLYSSERLPFLFGNLLLLIAFIFPFRWFHTYSGIVRYSTLVDMSRILTANFIAAVMFFLVSFVLKRTGLSPEYITTPGVSGCIMVFLISSIFMCCERMFVKSLFDMFRRSREQNTCKVFIYGVREGGVAIARAIMDEEPQKYVLSGFISPQGDFQTKWLLGVKIRRDGPNLIRHIKDAGVKAVIVSPLQADYFRSREELVQGLIDEGIKILMMPVAETWDGKSKIRQEQIKEVDIEDLLPRDTIEVDMELIGRQLMGRSILITGAAGSIGSEMVRQAAVYKPANMILIDQAETPMHDIRIYMQRVFPDIRCETVVTSIANREHMEKLFSQYRPDYVFHAAAYKHVPMMEDNPAIAVQNNIFGTRVIADLAVKYGTRKFVMISTDKAVNPTNVMGCSKRICEIYCQSLNKAIVDGKVQGVTQFVTTRFGNVLGSNGSVIPLFREQIRRGGPVTVTHPDIIRFFMLIPEACKLVLEAGTMGQGGEIFVFDMGKPVRIVDLARRMITLSGAKNIEIKFTGLRDGEKLYEEVLAESETTKPTRHPKIMIASVREYDYETALANEERLLKASYSFDDMEIVRIMKEIVPEYKSRCSKYEVLDK
ncbi:MAG: polysaccharide biosynthesis protein [Bacteroidaceae bacterium]|nr:polysaccharide biosynthesis protein [Bacteroidaceae bacterium]